MIAYASMYGNTENMAEILAVMLAEAGVKTFICITFPRPMYPN